MSSNFNKENYKKSSVRVNHVLDRELGIHYTHAELFNVSEEKQFQLRKDNADWIQNHGRPRFACSFCSQGLVIKEWSTDLSLRHYPWFSHLPDSLDCKVKTPNGVTDEEISEQKYRSTKESLAHIQMKLELFNELIAHGQFSNVKMEKIEPGVDGDWRKPDISAIYQGRKVAFEVQLSHQLIGELIKRDKFYQDNHISVFWVFKNFQSSQATAWMKDIATSNRGNIFSWDIEVSNLSERSNQIVFRGFYLIPAKTTDKMIWRNETVKMEAIRFDDVTLKPYFYDINGKDGNHVANSLGIQSSQSSAPVTPKESAKGNDLASGSTGLSPCPHCRATDWKPIGITTRKCLNCGEDQTYEDLHPSKAGTVSNYAQCFDELGITIDTEPETTITEYQYNPEESRQLIADLETAIKDNWNQVLLTTAMDWADRIIASGMYPTFNRSLIYPTLRMMRVILSVRDRKMLWAQQEPDYLVELCSGDLRSFSHHFVRAVEHYDAVAWFQRYDTTEFSEFKLDHRADNFFIKLFDK